MRLGKGGGIHTRVPLLLRAPAEKAARRGEAEAQAREAVRILDCFHVPGRFPEADGDADPDEERGRRRTRADGHARKVRNVVFHRAGNDLDPGDAHREYALPAEVGHRVQRNPGPAYSLCSNGVKENEENEKPLHDVPTSASFAPCRRGHILSPP